MKRRSRGVTLMEMLVVVALIALLAGVSMPAINSGIDSLRLISATDSTASFLNAALNRAERRQQLMEVTISEEKRMLEMRSSERGFHRELKLPDGIRITAISGPNPVVLYPGGTVPRIALELTNQRGVKKRVHVDPITGVPEVE